MYRSSNRRGFLKVVAAGAAAGVTGLGRVDLLASETKRLYNISLAEYSLHRMLARKQLDPLDLAAYAMKEFGIDAVERWSLPLATIVTSKKRLAELKNRSEAAGVRHLLIMVDDEGALGDPDEAARMKAVDNHRKWLDATKYLGGHSIRVNAYSEGTADEQHKRVVDGLRRLSEIAAGYGLNVIVENHGGLSSNGKWLAGVMNAVGRDNCGTLPDFGNFDTYDRYQGVEELMPFAKAVSAKSYGFDDQGNESQIDYDRMMKIVVDAGYRGYVGIEYEGEKLSEPDGVLATKRLLLRVHDKLAAAQPGA